MKDAPRSVNNASVGMMTAIGEAIEECQPGFYGSKDLGELLQIGAEGAHLEDPVEYAKEMERHLNSKSADELRNMGTTIEFISMTLGLLNGAIKLMYIERKRKDARSN